MIDPIQVAEARAAGADAILVILSAVDDALATDMLVGCVCTWGHCNNGACLSAVCADFS